MNSTNFHDFSSDESADHEDVIAKKPKKHLNIHLEHFVIFFGFFIILHLLSETANDIQEVSTACNELYSEPNNFERRFVIPNPYQGSQEAQYENIVTWQNAEIIQKYYENPI